MTDQIPTIICRTTIELRSFHNIRTGLYRDKGGKKKHDNNGIYNVKYTIFRLFRIKFKVKYVKI